MKKYLGIFVLLFIASSAAAFAQGIYYFPQIAVGNGWESDLYFTNQGISPVMGISINFYDDKGLLMIVESNLGIGSAYGFSLNPGATQVINITKAGAPQGYAIVMYPPGAKVSASEVYRYKPEDLILAKVGVPQTYPSNNLSFPVVIKSSDNLNTGVALVNPPQFNSIQTAVLTLIKTDGTVQATATLPLAVGEHRARYLTEAEFFPGVDNFTGSVSISSPWGLAALALFQDNDACGSIVVSPSPVLAPFLVPVPAVIPEVEPNNIFPQAQPIPPLVVVAGNIQVPGDVDYYLYPVGVPGQILSLTCLSDMINPLSRLNCRVDVYDAAMTLIASNDDSGLAGTNDSFVQIVLPAPGVYFIVVSDVNGNGGMPNFNYMLHVQ